MCDDTLNHTATSNTSTTQHNAMMMVPSKRPLQSIVFIRWLVFLSFLSFLSFVSIVNANATLNSDSNDLNDHDLNDFEDLIQVDIHGTTLLVDSKDLNYPFSTIPIQSNSNTNTNIRSTKQVEVYGNEDCNGSGGKSLTIPLDHVEKKCSYCWDACDAPFQNGSPSRLNIKSINVPPGIVVATFAICVGTYGNGDKYFLQVIEEGCTNVKDTNHLVFAEIQDDNTYKVLGTPSYEETGTFSKNMGVRHWSYGMTGMENAQGTSWYQYIFELLDYSLEEKRIKIQVGTGGTWLIPTQNTWKKGDPCLCHPQDWPATEGGKKCRLSDLKKCKNGCCGTDGCEHLFQTMEGGSGYWGGKLPTNAVKWTIGSVGGCYRYWSNSPLEVKNSDSLLCDMMGVIAVSNSLLYPPDGIGFEKESEGMLGHAWINSPIGKIHKDDDRRFLTLILDTKNFKGPIAYMLPEYYGVQSKWADQDGVLHPVETFMNSGMTTGGGAWEWSTFPAFANQDSDERTVRIPKIKISFNDEEGGDPKTVLMSGAKSYDSLNDLYTPLDEAMDQTNPNPTLDESKLLKLTSGHVHACNPSTHKDLKLDFEGNELMLGAHVTHRDESDGVCSAVVHWDTSSNNLICDSNKCKLKESYKIAEESIRKDEGEWVYDSPKMEALKRMPKPLEGDVFQTQVMKLNFDRREPKDTCGAKPENDGEMYCRETSTGDWIGVSHSSFS